LTKSPIFEKHHRDYLSQIGRIDLDRLPDLLGVERHGDEIAVPVFGVPYRVSADGIYDPRGAPADYGTGVILSRYLLQCPPTAPKGDRWRAFRDFQNAAPLLGYFSANVEQRIADHFRARLPSLAAASAALGVRRPALVLDYDFTGCFDPLPKVPVLLTFNDADAMFPVHCSVLFETRVEFYLDMECVAMIGALLAERLIGVSKQSQA
jgi:hypothetical protein